LFILRVITIHPKRSTIRAVTRAEVSGFPEATAEMWLGKVDLVKKKVNNHPVLFQPNDRGLACYALPALC
jgi:hypothetical protein